MDLIEYTGFWFKMPGSLRSGFQSLKVNSVSIFRIVLKIAMGIGKCIGVILSYFSIVSFIMWCNIGRNPDVSEEPNATICRARMAKAVNREVP
jgi:hypothetical protein